MSCINLGPATLPTIPAFFLAPPMFNGPVIGAGFCCKFQTPIPGLDTLLASLNAAVSAAMTALSAGAMVEIMTLNEIIHQAQIQLNELVLNIPECPVDGSI